MNMEVLDFVAGLIIQIGNYLKVRHRAEGWLLSCTAILYWIIRANTTNFTSQCFWHMVSFCMAAWGYMNWRKEKI